MNTVGDLPAACPPSSPFLSSIDDDATLGIQWVERGPSSVCLSEAAAFLAFPEDQRAYLTHGRPSVNV